MVDPRPPDCTEVPFLLGSEVPDWVQCVSGAYVGALVEDDKVVGGDLVLKQHLVGEAAAQVGPDADGGAVAVAAHGGLEAVAAHAVG